MKCLTCFQCNNGLDSILPDSPNILGEHSKASNFAVFSDLGQFPMLISTIARFINFWIHTIQSSNESLLSGAYWEQCTNLVLKCLWLSFINNILTDLGFSHVWINQSTFNASALLT